ncbi:MAG: PQQ-binding-like beta-propeller repeat protein [Kiritimatiellae bacterium]|nr:PQQ-binding-like beta-propeller repeat protein [Kiritimatiellia bacterium]
MRRDRFVKRLVMAALAVFLLVLLARQGYYAVHGQEDLVGTREPIPDALARMPPVSKGEADWPCWRGANRDGRSMQTGIRKDWSGGLRKLWQVNYLCQDSQTATWSAPVVQGSRLVVPGRDAARDLVLCLDPETGRLIWEQSYAAKVGGSHGPGPRATPYIDDDRVYTFGRGGDLVCWRLADGKKIWAQNVDELGGKGPTWGHASSPLVYEDKVIVQGGGDVLVVAFDKLTGRLAWKSMTGIAGYASPVVAPTPNGPRLLIFFGTGFTCLDPGNGKSFWSIPWETAYDANAPTPAVAGTTVFITSGYKTGCQALRLADTEPEILWRNKTIASHHSDPIIVDGHVYGYSGQSTQNKGDFKCVALDTGEEKWSTNQVGWGTVLYVDGHLLCMDIRGNLCLVKPDPGGFRKVTEWRGALGEVTHPAWTIPVVANGRIFLRYIQRLVCYSLVEE